MRAGRLIQIKLSAVSAVALVLVCFSASFAFGATVYPMTTGYVGAPGNGAGLVMDSDGVPFAVSWTDDWGSTIDRYTQYDMTVTHVLNQSQGGCINNAENPIMPFSQYVFGYTQYFQNNNPITGQINAEYAPAFCSVGAPYYQAAWGGEVVSLGSIYYSDQDQSGSDYVHIHSDWFCDPGDGCFPNWLTEDHSYIFH